MERSYLNLHLDRILVAKCPCNRQQIVCVSFISPSAANWRFAVLTELASRPSVRIPFSLGVNGSAHGDPVKQ